MSHTETLRAALNAMLTHMGMDEDEWNKVTFNQARAALAATAEPEVAPAQPKRDRWQAGIEPGGCDCHTCGCTFIGAEWKTECAACLLAAAPAQSNADAQPVEQHAFHNCVFAGPPPEGFDSWPHWTDGPRLENVRITSLAAAPQLSVSEEERSDKLGEQND